MKKILIGLGIAALFIALKNEQAIKNVPKLILVGFLPFNYHALTIPPFGIFIRKDQASNKNLIDHEMIHWQQYQAMGLLKYHVTYLKDLLIYGYDQMPMEVKARFIEDDFCKTHYTECVRSGKAKTITDNLFRS